jgi:hypothetical protein
MSSMVSAAESPNQPRREREQPGSGNASMSYIMVNLREAHTRAPVIFSSGAAPLARTSDIPQSPSRAFSWSFVGLSSPSSSPPSSTLPPT